VDATTVDANASLDSLEKVVIPFEAEEYLEKLEEHNPTEEDDDQPRLRRQGQKLSNQTHESKTDPEARIFRKRFAKTRLAYSDNVLMDNGSRVIVDVEVTEPNLHQEGQIAGQMVRRSRFALGIRPKTVGGDKAYGSGPALRSLGEAGVTPHVSHPKQRGKHVEGIFGKGDFGYDQENDRMICPAGKVLKRRTTHKRNRQVEYVARRADCGACELKPLCARGPYRAVHRHLDQDYLDVAAQHRGTFAYKISQRCRKQVEMLFGEGKQFMGLERARRRGRENVREQCLMTAMVQNIKRIVAAIHRNPALAGTGSAIGTHFARFRRTVEAVGLPHLGFSRLAALRGAVAPA